MTDDLKGTPLLREKERRSNDQIRVKNPTQTDYKVRWDSDKVWIVPGRNKDAGYGKGEAVLPRYVAEKYMKEMTTMLIYKESDKKIAPLKESKKGDPNVHWPAFEERQALRTNNPKLIDKHMSKLYLGVEKEFGRDMIEPEEYETKKVDKRPVHEQVMADIQNAKVERPEQVMNETPKEEFVKSIAH